jgi:hypothetical protein
MDANRNREWTRRKLSTEDQPAVVRLTPDYGGQVLRRPAAPQLWRISRPISSFSYVGQGHKKRKTEISRKDAKKKRKEERHVIRSW